MIGLTATKTNGKYKGSDLEITIAQSSPLKWRHVRWDGTFASSDPKYVAETIYYEAGVSKKFQHLVDLWSEDTIYMSSITAMVAHPSYLKIIALGEKAVPLLLGELEKSPNYWFHALTAITEEDPIPKEARGRLREMTEIWLEWGRDKDYF